MIAEDYFSPPEKWQEERPPEPDLFKDDRGYLNKILAHLTYDRINPPKKGWKVQLINQHLEKVMITFLNNVSDNCLCGKCITLKKRLGIIATA